MIGASRARLPHMRIAAPLSAQPLTRFVLNPGEVSPCRGLLLVAHRLIQQHQSRIFPVAPCGSSRAAQQASSRAAILYSTRHYRNHAQEPVPALV